jgi:uncharacterized membrane protein
VIPNDPNLPPPPPRRRASFGEDFRRFFLRGLSAVLPTLITLWLLVWAWNFLWNYLGQYILAFIGWCWSVLAQPSLIPFKPDTYLPNYLERAMPTWAVRTIGVVLAIVLVYVVGLFVGNFIGRTAWRLIEVGVMRIPLVRAIFPAVKQVTDFLLADRRGQFEFSRVVAVQPHEQGIWSIGLVTGPGLASLTDSVGEEMVSVFVPSTPTAFSGYLLVVPRKNVVELPLTVEEAMRLLISGGVITPGTSETPSGGGALVPLTSS